MRMVFWDMIEGGCDKQSRCISETAPYDPLGETLVSDAQGSLGVGILMVCILPLGICYLGTLSNVSR